MSVIVYQFQIVKFIHMMSLTFGLFTQVSGSGPLGPLVLYKTSLLRRVLLYPLLLLAYILFSHHLMKHFGGGYDHAGQWVSV